MPRTRFMKEFIRVAPEYEGSRSNVAFVLWASGNVVPMSFHQIKKMIFDETAGEMYHPEDRRLAGMIYGRFLLASSSGLLSEDPPPLPQNAAGTLMICGR